MIQKFDTWTINRTEFFPSISAFPDSHIFREAMMEEMSSADIMMSGTAVEITPPAVDAPQPATNDTMTPASDDTVTPADGTDDNHGSSRRKRATGEKKYLEVRVMADYDMLKYYGVDEVIPYTLTLMNIVSNAWRIVAQKSFK